MSTVFVEAAFYRLGARHGSVAQRRAAVAGRVGSSFEIAALIGEALGDHHGLSVALYHSNPGRPEQLIDRVGAAPAAAFTHETTIQIDGTWRAVVRGSATPRGCPGICRLCSLTASIGVALGERASAADLLRDADIALYEAKAAGRSCYMLFQSSMQTAAHDRLTLEMDLAEALEQRQLFLQYQPTFDLQSERVIGVEALIRWRHPKRGVIAPIEFIPIAEESGLIVPIGRWVLDEACRQGSIWYGEGHRIGMSVNVSGRQLDDDRSLLHQRHRRVEGLGSAHPHARATWQDARHRDPRRGHRGALPAGDAATRRLRPRPRLPILAPARSRRSREVPQRRRVDQNFPPIPMRPIQMIGQPFAGGSEHRSPAVFRGSGTVTGSPIAGKMRSPA